MPGIIVFVVLVGLVIQIIENWRATLVILAIGSILVVLYFYILGISQAQDRARKRQAEEEAEQERLRNRNQLYRSAQAIESQFYEVGSIEKQYDCLKNLASTASSLGVVYGNDTWVKIEACCRLLKRNCESGAHDRYWILADELHNAVQAKIREYKKL